MQTGMGYDTISYSNLCSKADIGLSHGTNNLESGGKRTGKLVVVRTVDMK